MKILEIEAIPNPDGTTTLGIIVDGNRKDIFDSVKRAREHMCSLIIEDVYEKQSDKQLKAIWGKLGELANALGTSKWDVYDECLRRYGIMDVQDVPEVDGALDYLKQKYRIVDVEDSINGKVAYCWKGIKDYDSKESKHFLDGVLSECNECGISGVVR